MYFSAGTIIQIIVFSIGFFRVANSQTKVHGLVTDTRGKPLASANVALITYKDSLTIGTAATDAKGSYSFNSVSAGKYLIRTTFTGYQKTYSSAIDIKNSKADISVSMLQLKEENAILKQVTVTAKKPLFEQKIDRMIVNVRNSITASGSTALDLLERSPGVIVNRQSNSLSMNGKDGVVIMINGKINRLPLEAVVQMLAGMSAGNIERIELITTPPANMDAEGNAGFINIVMINNTDFGTNGSFSLTGGYGNGETSQASINFNNRKGKFNLYGDYSVSRQHQLERINFTREFLYKEVHKETIFENKAKPVTINHNVRLGVDYQLDNKTVIGGLVGFYYNRYAVKSPTIEHININGSLDTLIKIFDEERNVWKHKSIGMNIQHTFKADEKVTISADYLNYHNANPTDYDNYYFSKTGALVENLKTRSRKTTPINVSVASADYTKKAGKNIDIEAGLKSSIARFSNDISFSRSIDNTWKMDEELSSVYKLKENIAAAYTTASIILNAETNIKAGIRYEYTNSNLKTVTGKSIVDRKYGQFFPSLFVTRKLDSSHSVNFSYSRRITRPTFNQLAPFLYFFDPNSYIQGNPALQPAISDNLKADYTYKTFIFSVSYSFEKNTIMRFQPKVDPETNRQIVTGVNLKSLRSIAGTFSLPFTINPVWNMQNNIITTWQHVQTSYNNVPIEFKLLNYRFTTTQNLKFPKNYSVELTGFIQSPSLNGRSRSKMLGTMNIGAQKKLGEKKGSLKFSITDVFHTRIFRFNSYIPDQYLNTTGRLEFFQRTFDLTYTRSFGNDKLKAKRNINGASEERKRVEDN